MVLVVLERANTHCCDREPLHATLKTLRRALPSVSRQNVVARFWNEETVHNGIVDVAGNGQTMAPEACGVGNGGHGGGQMGGQVGTGIADATGPVAGGVAGCGQAMASLAAEPAAAGAAPAVAGSAIPKPTDAMTATTASIPRVMLAILAMSGSPFVMGRVTTNPQAPTQRRTTTVPQLRKEQR